MGHQSRNRSIAVRLPVSAFRRFAPGVALALLLAAGPAAAAPTTTPAAPVRVVARADASVSAARPSSAVPTAERLLPR